MASSETRYAFRFSRSRSLGEDCVYIYIYYNDDAADDNYDNVCSDHGVYNDDDDDVDIDDNHGVYDEKVFPPLHAKKKKNMKRRNDKTEVLRKNSQPNNQKGKTPMPNCRVNKHLP